MPTTLLDEVEIHSISWDQVDRNITYYVGQKVRIGKQGKDRRIIMIARDENSFHLYGYICYRIYINIDGSPHLWRYIENKPVELVFKIHDNKEDDKEQLIRRG